MGSWLSEYSHGDGIGGDEIMNKAVLDIYLYSSGCICFV